GISSHDAPEKLLRCGNTNSVGSCSASNSFQRLVIKENFGAVVGWAYFVGGGFPSQKSTKICTPKTRTTAIQIPGCMRRDSGREEFAASVLGRSAVLEIMDVARTYRRSREGVVVWPVTNSVSPLRAL